MTSVAVCRGRCAATCDSLTSALITLLIIVEEFDEASSNLNLFGDGSDEQSLRSVGAEDGGGALMIGGITN